MFGIFALLALFSTAFGQEAAPPYESYEQFTESPGFTLFTVNNLWLLVSAALVFLMHLGFASLESGLTQSKNTVNILFKNMFIVCVGILGYALYGFNAMYPGDFNGIFAAGSWFSVDNNDVGWWLALIPIHGWSEC